MLNAETAQRYFERVRQWHLARHFPRGIVHQYQVALDLLAEDHMTAGHPSYYDAVHFIREGCKRLKAEGSLRP